MSDDYIYDNLYGAMEAGSATYCHKNITLNNLAYKIDGKDRNVW